MSREDARSGPDHQSPGAGPSGWRLLGAPPPEREERISRTVGLRVLRLPGSRRVLIVAGSVDRLRELAADPFAVTPFRVVTVVVAWWRRPRQGWSGAIGPLPRVLSHQVSFPRLRRGSATVTVRLAQALPLRDILRAVLPAVGSASPLPAPVSADLTSHGRPPAYLPATGAVALRELPLSSDIRAHDVVLEHGGPAPRDGYGDDGPPYGIGFRTGPHGLTAPAAVLIDARRINPRGRRADASRPDAPRVRLDFGPAGRGLGGRLNGTGPDATTLATLRQVGVVECPQVPATAPVETAALLVQLAATGAVLHAPKLPAPVADLIVPELRDIITGPAPAGDELAMEARSVRQRRAALRGHATDFALPRIAAGRFPELGRPPTVSALLATRRPEMLAGALDAIIGQTYPELEIVLCLHGIELPAEIRARLAGCGRPVEVLEVPDTISFGEALGAATRRANGTLVTKFDDDDSYGTEHVWDLVLARQYSGATLVGKGSEFVHLETLGITVRRPSGVPEADGELVAGGTMLLARGDLEAVGGWRPVPRSVDFGLLERLRQAGAVIFRTHPLGYVYHRRDSGHTWDPGQNYFLEAAHTRWTGIPEDAFANPPQPAGEPLALH
ncbi:glycosyltransferase [Polymorphospora lycopeni]|uniref:Glycosyltransferase n=1 Tax=Polymorphospora lycopeni TaxID=3140240 RepID=A0ABV5CZU7_9ACTN